MCGFWSCLVLFFFEKQIQKILAVKFVPLVCVSFKVGPEKPVINGDPQTNANKKVGRNKYPQGSTHLPSGSVFIRP